jgi:hypothetical protein
MRKIFGVLAGVVLGLAFSINVHADSIVQVAANLEGLAQVSPADLPIGGTYFWVLPGGSAVPMPCPPQDLSVPIFQIVDGQFLADCTGGQVVVNTRLSGLQGANSTVAAAVAAQADAVVNLITQVQARAANQQMRIMARAMSMDSPSLPSPSGDGDGGSDDYTNNYFFYSFDTNQLWLEITNVSNGWAYLNLHNGTNLVYAIWSTTNLLTGWQVETEVWPTNGTVTPTVTPFAVQNLDRQNLFLRAEDWTGVTENGNTTPDWWFWMFFGTTALSDTNLDSQGNTLLYDYEYGFDPNVISFTLSFTNQYASALDVPVQLSVTAGEPSYFAVLVDDTNYADANWTAYDSSNIIVNLGSTEGWHQVFIGLRGLPPDAYQTWQATRLKLDMTPPILVITNPAPGTVTRPLIQLQGYSPEALASISYDLTNAAGLVTNQQTLILGQYYDTNTLEFTTNGFQCFDVPLTNGLNTITLHATDLAGNATTTNFNFTLDYSNDTNPPTVQLGWPQAGTKISGSSFTWRGQIGDPTAQVVAQIVDTNGVTNSVVGRVGRAGDFWIDDLPLSGGTNNVSLIVTDAAGNTSVTTIPVIQSSLVLTITSAGLGQAVTGTISDINYTIWVNGTMATNNLDGTWTAQDPHLTLDTPTVQVRAIPNSDNGGYGGGL